MEKFEVLKAFAKAWFGNSQQHSIQAQLLKARGLDKLAAKIEAESNEEWDEAKRVNARLIALGQTPVVAIDEYPVFTDVKEMLEYDAKDAEEGLPEIHAALKLFEDDYVTAKMIQEFIVDEVEHLAWVKKDLAIIEQIGLENYLIKQMG